METPPIKVWQATTPLVLMFNPDFFCPVEEGKWYFGEVDACPPQGPFDTQEEATDACLTYVAKGGADD